MGQEVVHAAAQLAGRGRGWLGLAPTATRLSQTVVRHGGSREGGPPVGGATGCGLGRATNRVSESIGQDRECCPIGQVRLALRRGKGCPGANGGSVFRSNLYPVPLAPCSPTGCPPRDLIAGGGRGQEGGERGG